VAAALGVHIVQLRQISRAVPGVSPAAILPAVAERSARTVLRPLPEVLALRGIAAGAVLEVAEAELLLLLALAAARAALAVLLVAVAVAAGAG
jgi:hypothetical protein